MPPDKEPMHVETDVLIIGSGGAGMYAAITAARAGASVTLVDRSLIGRGGATVMAQMTVAAALGSETPDHWSHHFADTLGAGRGLCDERLAQLLCEEGPECIREMDAWGVGWARKDGHIAQALAPGHRVASTSISSIPARRCRKRCGGSSPAPAASARRAIL
jgi:succinate dehydrogenase / fumarate reductase, flavoprotein subunit